MKLSVVLATRNEEENIGRCLESVRDIADEIIIVDEESTDKTPEIAKSFGAKVISQPHEENFHKTKQKALDIASSDWILQLDADEVVTKELARDIKKVLQGEEPNIPPSKQKMFKRHQELIEKRDGIIGKDEGEIVGYFIPRKNMFLGKGITHAGLYPDGVIRLVKKGCAHFPLKTVHEQIMLNGRVGWLSGDLLHYDSPTLKRYFARLNRYTDLQAVGMQNEKTKKNIISFVYFVFYKPILVFLLLFFRHLGFLDGARGFLWSFFSASHYPIAYYKYITNKD